MKRRTLRLIGQRLLLQTVHTERCHRRLASSTRERLASGYIGRIVRGAGPMVGAGKPGIWKAIAWKTGRKLVAIYFIVVLGESQIRVSFLR
jgi:hypothetical protein